MQLRTIQRSCFPPLHPAFSRHHATRFFPKRRVPVTHSQITLKWSQRDLFVLLAASHCFSDSPAWFWGFGLSPKRHLGAVTCGRLDSGTEGRFSGTILSGFHGGLLLRFTTARFAFCHPGFLTPTKGRNRNRGRTIGARIGEYFPIFPYPEEPGLVPFCPVEVFRDRKDKRNDPHGGDGEYTGTWPGRQNGSAGSTERASSTWLWLIKRAIRYLPFSC